MSTPSNQNNTNHNLSGNNSNPTPSTKKIPIHLQSSQNRLLIKNGKLVNDDAIFKADIYIEDGIIKDIGPHLMVPGGVKTIDAHGNYVIPGGIDTNTHLNIMFMGAPTADDFYSGTRAALAGGTTTLLSTVMTAKGQSLIEAYKNHRSLSDGFACCDYFFRVGIPEFKKGTTDVEMEALTKDYGINSFKIFMTYDMCVTTEDIINTLNKCRQIGALLCVHAENDELIKFNTKKLLGLGVTGPEGHLLSHTEEGEAEAMQRIIILANQINCPIFIAHVNCKMGADVIAQFRNRGCIVYAEVITAGIGSDGTHYFHKCWQHAAAHVMSPPLRPDKTTSPHLIDLLANNQLQTTGSDHCVFRSTEKALGMNDFTKIPNGVNGTEERLMILWEKGVKTGKLDPRKFVAITSTNAAKLFNLYPKKGRLAKGSDADIVIWGPKPHVISASTHHSNGDFNIFEGTHVSHGPLVVISNGRVVLDESGLHVVQGSGKFLPCAPNSSYLWHSIRERERVPIPRVDRSGKEDASNGVQNKIADQPNEFSMKCSITPPHFDPAYSIHKESEMTPQFYKGTTRSGVRNLQDSSFSLTGAQIDDDKIGKTAIRVQNPPGGRSSGIW
ncbi:Pyruvate dehydrogenase lipoamide kinase [Sarcoptes scabiei]|nr:Pyruvate dehydrogenase lipoamide kinase [Sarcoptes scabiei]